MASGRLPGQPADETHILDFRDWRRATRNAAAGQESEHWFTEWKSWGQSMRLLSVYVDADLDLFDNKGIEVVIDGSTTPYTDADHIPHTWYGRCMMAILDDRRWIMALRSGVNHIAWGDRDTIHVMTSSDEGRTWGALDTWFDGSPIVGMPFEDGYTHSEAGLFTAPNGDLLLQFWRTDFSTGTRQLRSTDQGKTWRADIDRIAVRDVPGADVDRVLGAEDSFIDPENLDDLYMAFQYFHYDGQAGTLLAQSQDNGSSYQFVSWIVPLAKEKTPDSGATFEPAIEYVGNRTIIAIMRDAAGNGHTWQTMSTDMGRSFALPVDISRQINGGVDNGQWQRARLYKESNPRFRHGNKLNYAMGDGRLWGFGLHSNGGGYTRKPVVYWSDDNAQSWSGPELLHGSMYPGTDTGYGDLKRRIDGTYVGATYYANSNSTIADLEQYTFGGERARLRIEFAEDDDGEPGSDSGWHELSDGPNRILVKPPVSRRWRLRCEGVRDGVTVNCARLEGWHCQ